MHPITQIMLGACLLVSCDAAQAETNIKKQTNTEIDAKRADGHFRRAYDGHVSVQMRNGDWMDIRCDPQTEGVILLRANDGKVGSAHVSGAFPGSCIA
jgi:hypothetical protein